MTAGRVTGATVTAKAGRITGATRAATTGGRAPVAGLLGRATGGQGPPGGHPARAAGPSTGTTEAGTTATATTVPSAGTVSPAPARTSAGTVSSATTARLRTAPCETTVRGETTVQGTVRPVMTVRTAPRARGRADGRKRADGPRRAGTLPGQPGVPDIPRAVGPQVSGGAQDRADISDICSQAAGLRATFTFSVTRTPTRSAGCGRLTVAVGGLCDRNSLPDSTKSQRS